MIEVYSVSDPELCYEWDELHVYTHPADPDKFVVHTDGGCSCNYYEQPAEAELRPFRPLTAAEAHSQISAWLDSHGTSPNFRTQELERAHLALRNEAPA